MLQTSASALRPSYTWRAQHLIDSGTKPGITSRDVAELVAARRRIAALETELAATKRANEPLRQAMAISSRSKRDGTIIHSDHGTQFTSWAFTQRVRESGLVASMGSIGDCFDNAVMESLWGRMQVELLDRRRWKTRIELANAIFEHLEIFHNRQRRHSSLGMLTPIEFENVFVKDRTVA